MTGDAALARFRMAEATAARDPEAARNQFLAVARDFPAHPLADEALRRIGGGTPPPPMPAATPVPPPAAALPELAPADRLRRAESLTKDRHWDEALAELGKLPAGLPPELAAERDYQIGMTKFHMRRDYAAAGELLLAAVPHLSGDKAASAQFHGARALSRADRDDEAISGYRKVVAQFPHSSLRGGGAVSVGLARLQPRAVSRELARAGGHARTFRQQRLRGRCRLVRGVRALPARGRARSRGGIRPLWASPLHRPGVGRGRSARRLLEGAPPRQARSEGRGGDRLPRDRAAGPALLLRACWRGRG